MCDIILCYIMSDTTCDIKKIRENEILLQVPVPLGSEVKC